MAMIEVCTISKCYRNVEALKSVTLSIESNSVFGFLGQNGAGKTTLIRILAGLIKPSSGSCQIDGMGMQRAERSIGYLAQQPTFYPWMTGRELLMFSAKLYKMDARMLKQRINEVLDLCGIQHAVDRRIGQYSGGMVQRLGIAQAILHKPKVVLLDEPASALDPVGRKEILTLIGNLREEATIFMSSHILEDIQRVCNEVAIIKEGTIILQEKMGKLLSSHVQTRIHLEFEKAESVGVFQEIVGEFCVGCQRESSTSISLSEDEYANQYEQIMMGLGRRKVLLRSIRTTNATLEDVFMHHVSKEQTYA